MKLLLALLVWTSCLQSLVVGRAVFAHFMVSNTKGYTVANWEFDMLYAQAAHIDAFALNMAYAEQTTIDQLGNAFQAANNRGFKLFFSFDYAGNGPWPLNDVIDLLTQYAGNGGYWLRGTQPLASTFEGPNAYANWTSIKAKTGCFFIPDWSSKGAKEALKLGNADGLFNWGAWPEGANDLYNTIDASYSYYLGLAKLTTYMMPASPWFYTNMPCFDKNWLWRGGSLWYDRWQQIWTELPEYVQIISWNDFGESHYIGPLPPYDAGYEAFTRGQAPFNYVQDMSHSGWRAFLPFLIDVYKNGVATITREGIQTWYRLQPAKACGNGGTTGNTGSQLQTELDPALLLTDTIFFSALLISDAVPTVTVGGVGIAASWLKKPQGGIGVYHGSAAFGSQTGEVVVRVTRNGVLIASVTGAAIRTSCNNGLTNWNAWTGSWMSTVAVSATPPPLSSQVCIAGKGVGNLAGLCSYSCERGYCPLTSCTCTMKGTTAIKPVYLVPTVYGCPVPSLDPQYEGLCSFACGTGYCPPGACMGSTTKTTCITTPAQDPPIPAASPMRPRPTTCPIAAEPGSSVVCNLGTIPAGVDENFRGLCDFSCNHNYCPKPCICLRSGFPAVTPQDATIGCPAPDFIFNLDYYPLCAYACSHGYCPAGACVTSTTACASLSEPVTEPDWALLRCDSPTLTGDADARTRWDFADTTIAWETSLDAFKIVRGPSPVETLPKTATIFLYGKPLGQFMEKIGSFFHVSTGRQCQFADNTGCDVPAECEEISDNNVQSRNSPAGTFIINSVAQIHTCISNLGNAIKDAQSNSLVDAGSVAMMTNFADSTKALIALDTIMLIFGLGSAATFAKALKNLPDSASPGTRELVENSLTALVGFGVNYGKNLVPTNDVLSAISNFQSLSGAIFKVMRDSNADTAAFLFGGTNDGITALNELIKDGKALDVQVTDTTEVTKLLEQAVAAVLLPYIWSSSDRSGGTNMVPWIMTSEGIPGLGVCEPGNPPPLVSFADQKNIDSYVCIDGLGYWLLAASVTTCVRVGGCTGGWATLKGIEKLDQSTVNTPDEMFSGLTKDAMVKSALAAYKANGNKNGWAPANVEDRSTILAIAKMGVEAPGIFNVPICKQSEATLNIFASARTGISAHWPCD